MFSFLPHNVGEPPWSSDSATAWPLETNRLRQVTEAETSGLGRGWSSCSKWCRCPTRPGSTTRYTPTHLRARKTPGTCRPGHRCEGPCGARVLDGLRQRLRGLLAEGPCDRRDGDLRRCGCAPGFSCLGKPGGPIAHELKGKPNEVDIRPGLRAPATKRGAGTQLHAPGRAPGPSQFQARGFGSLS